MPELKESEKGGEGWRSGERINNCPFYVNQEIIELKQRERYA